jgi:hypothetical protein
VHLPPLATYGTHVSGIGSLASTSGAISTLRIFYLVVMFALLVSNFVEELFHGNSAALFSSLFERFFLSFNGNEWQ